MAQPRVKVPESTPDWLGRPTADIDYHAQWRAFATRWYTAMALLVAFVPGAAAILFYSRYELHQSSLGLLLVLIWMAAALAAVWWTGEFRCPRCHRRYGSLGHKSGSTNMTFGFFEKVCSNCKLRKFERG